MRDLVSTVEDGHEIPHGAACRQCRDQTDNHKCQTGYCYRSGDGDKDSDIPPNVASRARICARSTLINTAFSCSKVANFACISHTAYVHQGRGWPTCCAGDKLAAALFPMLVERRPQVVGRHDLPVASNLLARHSPRRAADQIWLADISYIPTDAGWLHLAAIKDMATGQIVGWPPEDRPLHGCPGHGPAALAAAERPDPNAACALSSQLLLKVLRRPLSPASTPRSSSATAAVTQACAPRWVRSATPTTMPCARASSPRSNASFSLGCRFKTRPRRAMRRAPSSNNAYHAGGNGGGEKHPGNGHVAADGHPKTSNSWP